MTVRGPRRRSGDNRPWTWADQQDFEDGIRDELKELRNDLSKLGNRISWVIGILAAAGLVIGPVVAGVLTR